MLCYVMLWYIKSVAILLHFRLHFLLQDCCNSAAFADDVLFTSAIFFGPLSDLYGHSSLVGMSYAPQRAASNVRQVCAYNVVAGIGHFAGGGLLLTQLYFHRLLLISCTCGS